MLPQIIVIGMYALGLGFQSKEALTEKSWITLFASITRVSVMNSLLYWGGFYDIFWK